jgi:hypothetical protein
MGRDFDPWPVGGGAVEHDVAHVRPGRVAFPGQYTYFFPGFFFSSRRATVQHPAGYSFTSQSCARQHSFTDGID